MIEKEGLIANLELKVFMDESRYENIEIVQI